MKLVCNYTISGVSFFFDKKKLRRLVLKVVSMTFRSDFTLMDRTTYFLKTLY